MLIKVADDRRPDIATLETLRDRPGLEAATRRRIDREIRIMQAGDKGEREAAYEIEFLLHAKKNQATIHDLRIEVDGRVAQIDHLIVDRLFGITVCESKHFSQGVRVDERGEWTSYYGREKRGIPSPIEQNRKHIEVLKDLFDRGMVELPSRLGLTIKPRFFSLILISPTARIDRPKGEAAKRVERLDTVIKADHLRAALERQWNHRNELEVVKLVSASRMEKLARDLAALHRPIQFDWAAKFGIRNETMAEPVSLPVRVAGPTALCDSCGLPVSDAERRYSRSNAARFAGRILCIPCQAAHAPTERDTRRPPASVLG